MTKLIIQSDSPQAIAFMEYAATLPFIKIEGKKPNRSFEQASIEAGGVVTADEFFDELDKRLDKHFKSA